MAFSVDVKNKAARWGANASLIRFNTFDIGFVKISHDTSLVQLLLASPRKTENEASSPEPWKAPPLACFTLGSRAARHHDGFCENKWCCEVLTTTLNYEESLLHLVTCFLRTRRFSIVVPEELAIWLEKEAVRQSRTRNNLVNLILQQYRKNHV
jgi:hypothetical protein